MDIINLKQKQNVSETTVNIKPRNYEPSAKTVLVRPARFPLDGKTGLDYIDSLDIEELKLFSQFKHNGKHRKYYDARMLYLTREKELKRTEDIKRKRERLNKLRHESRQMLLGSRAGNGGTIHAESREVGDMDMSSDGVVSTHENLMDRTGEIEQTVTAGKSLHDTQDGGDTKHTLDEFFARPVSVYDGVIATDTESDILLRVWNLWSLNPAVRAKLSNYSFFKGNLHLKISVSGTPYHYGRLMASYQPYAIQNRILEEYDNLLASTTPGPTKIYPLYKCYLSQAPGVGYIDVKENEPLIMDLPFISYKERFRLFNTAPTVITETTELYDFQEAGELRLVTLNPLKIANSDYDTHASINIFAWVTDIELGCITGTNIDITAESADVTDEYTGKGPVSSVASAVMQVGDRLSSVPLIGEFAKATSTLARGVKTVAEFFGWSKPVVLENTIFVKNAPFQNGATLAGHETTLKLTLDPKQELSVDPTLGGVNGTDDMSIVAITSRESFLTTFEWNDSDTAMTTVLWKSFVTPNFMQGTGTIPSLTRPLMNQPTALAYGVAPFKYWRGSIKYRLEFVCSKFHRGKVLIRYEPNTPMSTLISTGSAQLNQQNTMILDLQQSQEITFKIGWAQCRSWAKTPHNYKYGIAATPADIGVGASALLSTFNNNELNGYIEIRPINELIQPTSTSPVLVNVYVSSDDMEVMVPISENLPYHRDIPFTESRTVNDVGYLNPKDGHTGKIHLDHFGEKIMSFRALLKRYATTEVIARTDPTPTNGMWILFSRLYQRPASPVGEAAVSSTEPEIQRTLFDYLRFSYLGMRGGMRKRVIPVSGDNTVGNLNYVRTLLDPPLNQSSHNTGLFRYDADSILDIKTNVLHGELEGSVIHHLPTNGGIEFEVPFYHPDLFVFAFNNTEGNRNTTDTDLGVTDEYTASWQTQISTTSGVTGDFALAIDSATAEDFTFLRFQGAVPFGSSTLP